VQRVKVIEPIASGGAGDINRAPAFCRAVRPSFPVQSFSKSMSHVSGANPLV
jgi:hypothetical protein